MRKLWLLLPAGVALGALLIRNPADAQTGDGFGILRADAPPAAAAPLLPSGVEPVADASPGPVNPFPLTPVAGPWLICAAHFPGPEGLDLAVQTVNELRGKHRYQAFILNRGDEQRRQQDAEWVEFQRRMHGAPVRRRMMRIEDEFAVLVGGFETFDAATASLPKVRALPMPGLSTRSGASPFAEMFFTVPNDKKAEVRTAKVNPYTQAMVVRNPTTAGAANKAKWDPFLVKLNEDEEYSLLKSSKPYTLLVKEYSGAQLMQSETGGGGGGGFSLLGLLGLKGQQDTPLTASAAQAHALAEFLRAQKMGLDVYVLHTRRSSLVTVGGFDSQTDQAILNTARKVVPIRFTPDKHGTGSDPIGLLANPVVIEVPRP